jgi:hypothetical protein
LEHLQKDNAAHLAELIIGNGTPHKDSETRIQRLSGRSLGTSSPQFRALLDELTSKVTKSTNQVDIDSHKNCLNHILNTLALCSFRFEWVSLPTNPPNFANGEYLRWLGFSRLRMERCIDVLLENGVMVEGRKGFKGGSDWGARAKASQYYPTEAFIRDMCESLYTEYGDFDANTDGDLYRFKRFEVEHIPPYETYQHKIETIRRYNSFMREHSWAMKNPSHLTIKDFVGRSGRVTNYYQNIAQRRVPIRTSTLLDGYPIAEPDFSANHLRMASTLVGEELPDDPYTEIAHETGLSRVQIKSIVTKCMGASSLRQKGSLIRFSHLDKIPVDAENFRATLASFEQHYPWTKGIFFHDVGTRLQYLEGEIALHMMEWSVREEIPLLAVHDAFAVRESDGQQTYDYMHHIWDRVLKEAYFDDFLANTEYTIPIVIDRNKAK